MKNGKKKWQLVYQNWILFSSISKGWNLKNWDYFNRKKESLKTNSKHIRSQRKIKEKQQEEKVAM